MIEKFADGLDGMIFEATVLLVIAYVADVDHPCDPAAEVTVVRGGELAEALEFDTS